MHIKAFQSSKCAHKCTTAFVGILPLLHETPVDQMLSLMGLLMWAAQVVKALGQDMVIFRADNGVGTVSSKVIGVHNPGTPESALIDMRLLSECNELVVTVGSSYGSVAAGWGGIPPVQMIHGLHKNVQVGGVRGFFEVTHTCSV